DHPGARERHKRWRAQLGFDVEHKAVMAGATVVAREPDAPFDLLREVGRGGAGAVYEAVDRELGRHVALKVYHQPERDRTQLAHEAKVAVQLEGPGIVRVFDIDPDHGWVALEWASHGTVREQIRARELSRLLPIERWAMPLAQALARVHGAGWVHHDVKPANVLLARTGAAILTDFGIARRAGEPSPPGSLGYISPERMAGRPSDPRDDVYGFGRILEDVLDVVKDDALAARYRPLAAACTGPDAQRPADARALLTRLRVELAPA
ncbi:MAG TPA: serine/threonine-protein kinase, partial [Labilithrix sp.]